MANDGWIKLHRKFLNSPLYNYATETKNFKLIKFWIFCLLKANYKNVKWYNGKEELIIKKGSFISSLEHMAKEANISIQGIRSCLKHLENMEMITHKATNKWTEIFICNYTKYQAISNRQSNKPTTNQQQTNNKPTTTSKEVKNIKKGESTPSISLKKFFSLKEKDFKPLKEKFPEVNVKEEYELAKNWLKATGKKYKNYLAFFNNWLIKSKGYKKQQTGEESYKPNRWIPPRTGTPPTKITLKDFKKTAERIGAIK